MRDIPSYDPASLEAKWQARWAERHTNEPDLDRAARPFYNLMMFPYPSAEGLHVGNMFAFTGADIYGRFKRLQGYDVFEPMGFDAFGIHSENYALNIGTNPAKLIPQNIATFRRQLRRFGGMFDWRHELSTTDPAYYKWTQWLFLQLFQAGLAYKKRAAVNWCPKDKTVLANEQVIDGRCERCDTPVEQRSPVKAYQRVVQSKDVVSRRVGDKTKSGVFIGSYARNPATGEAIPIWIADYVLMEYGTGAIMAVPAHDKRDFEFATQFKLPIRQVVHVPGESLPIVSEEGTLMNSAAFDGLDCREGSKRIVVWLSQRGLATPRVQYRLHDWCISRQRYWGPPIPIIYCEKCGAVPVPETDLPVELPLIEDFRPDDTGVSPLARHEEWYFVKCPQCGGRGRRETDVSDTFLDSAWYHLRYPSTESHDRPFDAARTKKWLPVSSYIGGNEHAVLHLLYARFICMVLFDLKLLHFDTPYPKFRAHGLIVKDGAKMSKSRGNVVVPDTYIQEWGADTFRMYLMFLGPFQEGGDFRDEGIVGIRRFLEKVWTLTHEAQVTPGQDRGTPTAEQKLHRTIRKVTADTEGLQYNTAISAMMEYVNQLREQGAGSRELLEPLVIMLAPYAPHIAEELWEVLGHKETVVAARWPAYDEKLASAGDVEIAVQVNGKLRSRIVVPRGMAQEDVMKMVMADEAVKKFVDGKPVKKAIYVQDRLVNLVV